jgi:hypothetical protein
MPWPISWAIKRPNQRKRQSLGKDDGHRDEEDWTTIRGEAADRYDRVSRGEAADRYDRVSRGEAAARYDGVSRGEAADATSTNRMR